VKHWRALISAIEEHERGHLENARSDEAAVAAELSKFDTASTCGAAARAAERAALEIIWEHQSHDRNYDLDTRNGRDQFEAGLARD
jgi:predicted secreted Zn-dependent protease